jgi:hypothetical protein
VDSAERYGRAFGVSAGWLLSGEGEIARLNIVRIEGLVGAGGAVDTSVESIGHEGLDEIELPFSLPEEAVAYRVNGDSMWPRYDDGDVIVVFKRPQPIESCSILKRWSRRRTAPAISSASPRAQRRATTT